MYHVHARPMVAVMPGGRVALQAIRGHAPAVPLKSPPELGAPFGQEPRLASLVATRLLLFIHMAGRQTDPSSLQLYNMQHFVWSRSRSAALSWVDATPASGESAEAAKASACSLVRSTLRVVVYTHRTRADHECVVWCLRDRRPRPSSYRRTVFSESPVSLRWSSWSYSNEESSRQT